ARRGGRGRAAASRSSSIGRRRGTSGPRFVQVEGEGGADPHQRVARGVPIGSRRISGITAYDVFMPRTSTRSRPELGRARGERHDDHRVEPLVLDRVRDYDPGTDATGGARSELRRRTFCSRSDLTYGEKLREGGLDRSSYRRQFSSYP